MTITHNLDMDLMRPALGEVVRCVQGEAVSRVLCFHLTRDAIAFSPPEGAKAAIRFGKPDGTGGLYDTLPDGTLAYAIAANTVSCTLAPQVLTCPGVTRLQLVLYRGDAILSTFTVYLLVEEDPSASGDPSRDYRNWLDATMDAMEVYFQENPLPTGLRLAQNALQIQAFLDAGTPVLVADSIALEDTVVMRWDNAHLEFGPRGQLDLQGRDFPAIAFRKTNQNQAPRNMTVRNARILGNGLTGSGGLSIHSAGMGCRVEGLEVTNCEFGIRTEAIDAARELTVEDFRIYACDVAIEDSQGGLNGASFSQGQLEGSRVCGMNTRSTGLRFMGVSFRNNGGWEVKLLNAPNVDEDTLSTASFTGCSFRHQSTSAGKEPVFRLGDSTQAEGWYGQLHLLGCSGYLMGNYLAACLGDGLPVEEDRFHGSQGILVTVLSCCFLDGLRFYLPATAQIQQTALPQVTPADNGKVLTVVNGHWQAV